MAVLKLSPFITKLREIEAANKLIFDKFDSKEITMQDAQIMSNKLWKDFIKCAVKPTSL